MHPGAAELAAGLWNIFGGHRQHGHGGNESKKGFTEIHDLDFIGSS